MPEELERIVKILMYSVKVIRGGGTHLFNKKAQNTHNEQRTAAQRYQTDIFQIRTNKIYFRFISWTFVFLNYKIH